MLMFRDTQAALEDLSLVLAINPAHADALYGIALAHSTLGDHQVWRRCCLFACLLGGRTDTRQLAELQQSAARGLQHGMS